MVFGSIRRRLDARAQQVFRLIEVARLLAHQAQQVQRVGIAGRRGEQGATRGFGRRQLAASHQVVGFRKLEIPVHARKSSMRRPAGEGRLARKKKRRACARRSVQP
jgi:hypothetical protein